MLHISNDYCIVYFNLCQHSETALEQKMSTICMYSLLLLTSDTAFVHIPAVGYVTDALIKHYIKMSTLSH